MKYKKLSEKILKGYLGSEIASEPFIHSITTIVKNGKKGTTTWKFGAGVCSYKAKLLSSLEWKMRINNIVLLQRDSLCDFYQDAYKSEVKELRNKLSPYEEYKNNYKKQIIAFLKDNILANEQAMKQHKEGSLAYEHIISRCYAYYKTLNFIEGLGEDVK